MEDQAVRLKLWALWYCVEHVTDKDGASPNALCQHSHSGIYFSQNWLFMLFLGIQHWVWLLSLWEWNTGLSGKETSLDIKHSSTVFPTTCHGGDNVPVIHWLVVIWVRSKGWHYKIWCSGVLSLVFNLCILSGYIKLRAHDWPWITPKLWLLCSFTVQCVLG